MIPDAEKSSRSGHAASAGRAHFSSLAGKAAGDLLVLPADQARHLVRSRRLAPGAEVEAFDDAGRSARALLEQAGAEWGLRLESAPAGPAAGAGLTVYSAVPKGARADWMVEKLSELGVARFVPLLTERSVVEPGAGKLERFARVARESAKQSRRSGTLRIDSPTTLGEALAMVAEEDAPAAVLATEVTGRPLAELDVRALLVGPEGGWTPAELEAITGAGVAPATLTGTILRVETAAVCAAAIVLVRNGSGVVSRGG